MLKADEGMKDADIVSALNTSRPNVECTRKRFVEGNRETDLYDDPRPGRKPNWMDEQKPNILRWYIAMPPDGQKWSLRMLSDKLVELEIVDDISHETVRDMTTEQRGEVILSQVGAMYCALNNGL